jgi:hypothetical protein
MAIIMTISVVGFVALLISLQRLQGFKFSPLIAETGQSA